MMFKIFGIPMLLKRMVDSDHVKINSNLVFDNQFLFEVLDMTGFRNKIVGDVLTEHISYYVEICSSLLFHWTVAIKVGSS